MVAVGKGGREVIEVAKEIKRGNLTSVFIALLLVVAMVTIPLADQKLTEDTVREIVRTEVVPLILENIEVSRENSQSIAAINDANMLDMRDKAIVAYNSKIFTVEDLQPLTLNGLAVRNGLRVPEIRQALFTIDPERTLLLEAYFAGQ